MATLEQINARIGSCEGQIDEYNIRIRRAEKDYEDLLRFKSVVQKSQGDFNSSNSKKILALEKVKNISKYNNIAKKYYESMKKSLSETGSKVLGIAYVFLLNKISSELTTIRNKIASYENSINSCNRRINQYRKDYETEKERLEKEI